MSVAMLGTTACRSIESRDDVMSEKCLGTANMSANVIPQEMATISTPWKTWSDARACKEEWLKNLPLLHFVYSAINPVALKSLMQEIGLPAGPLRKPLTALPKDRVKLGLGICKSLGLGEKYGYSIKG